MTALRTAPATIVLGLMLAGAAHADDASNTGKASSAGQADKSGYTLFNPTPDNLLREFKTDRPDVPESPFTVDAGHIQFETTLFGYTRSRPDAGVVTDSYEYGTTEIRLGLTNNSEFDLTLHPYGAMRDFARNPLLRARRSGIGDVELGTTINFWGNDSFKDPGATAFGILPHITVPTDRGNGIGASAVEGGLIVPFAVKLSDKFDLTLNAGFDAIHNEDIPGYHPEYSASASLGYDWGHGIGTYYQVASRFNTHDRRGDSGLVGTGLTYELRRNVQLDAGINFGVTRAADRYNPFVGLSTRF